MIPLSYTRTHPRTMVIKLRHAAIARIAMLRSGRSVNVARGAIPVSQRSAQGYYPARGDAVTGGRRSYGTGNGREYPRIGRGSLPQGQ